MIDLGPVWEFLAGTPGLAAARAHWIRAVGQEAFGAIERLLLTGGRAATFPHPDDGRPLKVVQLSRGRIGAVCEATGEMVLKDIPKDDVRLHRLNLSRLRGDLALALGLTEDVEPIRVPAKAFALGTWNPDPARTVPIFLLCAPTQKCASDEAARLVMTNKDGFVLIVPMLPNLDRTLWATVKDAKGVVLPLGQIGNCDDDGKLVASPGWDKAKANYCQQFMPGLAAGPRYAFCYAGGMWHLTFDGKTTHVDDTVGAKYIAIVLDKPGQHFRACDLPRIAEGGPVLKTAQETVQEIISPEGKAAMKARLQEIETDLAEAKQMGNEAGQEALQAEKEQLLASGKKSKGAFGKARRFQTTKDKARTSVTTAIARTRDHKSIRKDLPDAWRHLKANIQTGSTICYTRDPAIQWEVSMNAQ